MKNKFLTLLSYILVACIASVVTFAVCANTDVLPTVVKLLPAKYRPLSANAKLVELESIITQQYIGDVDQQTLEDYAAAGMVQGTGDRWSYYIPASQMQAHTESQNNAYVGIGITVVMRDDGQGIDIIGVTKGGPAEEAGILPGDILCAVGDKLTSELGMDATTDLIRGEEGSKVEITVLRGKETLTFSVERRTIEVVIATGEMLPGNIGLVRIENFNSHSAQRTKEVIAELQAQGATSLILDVRNNPGGYRHELVNLLDYLLPEGVLFRSEHYDGTESVDTSDKNFLDMPMVVLVNGDSYSAAEFFAAALREYEAAAVVGTQTCGKGYYQQTLMLSDGSAVNLSTGRYYTPKGVCLTEVGGLTPDYVVEVDEPTYLLIAYDQLPADQDPQIQQAVKVLQGK